MLDRGSEMVAYSKMKKPVVTIITPTYNHELFIGRCIRSVLSQSFVDWEMVIIDDGSNDSTAEIIKAYDDTRIIFVEQQHVGALRLADTYNKALSLSQGELIAILEGDDCWPENKLEIQVPRLLHEADCVLIWGRAIIVDEDDKHIGQYPAANNKRQSGAYAMLEELLLKNPIPAVSVVMRRDALRSVGGFQRAPGLPAVDFPTWLSLSLVGKFWFMEETVGYWRRHVAQVTLKDNVESRMRANQHVEEYYCRLNESLRNSISINEMTIMKNNIRKLSQAYIRRGRILLMKKEWRGAREAFLQAYRHGGTEQRIASVCGAIMSFLHMDIETAAKLLRKDTLPKVADQ